MIQISSDMTIGDILKSFPKCSERLIQVMQEYGLHCVGCHAKTFESLKQGVLGHGLGADILEEIVKKLNHIVSKENVVPEKSFKIILTDNALAQVRKLLLNEGPSKKALRISLVSGGCAGASYQMDLADQAEKTDLILTKKDINIFIPKEHLSLLNGLEIDYKTDIMGSSFKFKNPNSTGTCGCGTSFDFEE